MAAARELRMGNAEAHCRANRTGIGVLRRGRERRFLFAAGRVARGSGGRVYAFEPLPENAAFLRKHLAMNRIRNVEIFEKAISDRPGTASFSSESTRAMGKLAAAGTVTVATATLDQLIAEGRRASKHNQDGYRRRGVRRTERRPQVFRTISSQALPRHPWQGRPDECCQLLSSWNLSRTDLSCESEERAELFARPIGSRKNGTMKPRERAFEPEARHITMAGGNRYISEKKDMSMKSLSLFASSQ